MRRSHSQDNNLYLNLLGPSNNPEKRNKSLQKNKKTNCLICEYGIIHVPLHVCVFQNKFSKPK